MCGAMLVAAAVALGVDAGWQPLADGRLEYIIQIEPYALESLASGREIVCEVPPGLKGIASYRVRVGTASLPHEQPPEPEQPQEPAPTNLVKSPAESLRSAPVGPTSPWPTTSPADVLRPQPVDAPLPLAEVPDGPAGPERLAVYNQTESAGDTASQGDEPADVAASKPWLPFTLALAAFFGAFGGMLFTGWIAWDYRCRYRALLERMLAPDTPSGEATDGPE